MFIALIKAPIPHPLSCAWTGSGCTMVLSSRLSETVKHFLKITSMSLSMVVYVTIRKPNKHSWMLQSLSNKN